MSARNFNVLQEETYIMPSRTAEVRKALKKLREIDALKEKTDYTPEELEKLASETYWKNILEPPDTKCVEEAERKSKQYKRHLEKEAKKEAKRLAEEERMRKQNDARLKREAEEMARKKQRHYERKPQREYEDKMQAELERVRSETQFKQQYINEFAMAISIYKCPDRAFRKLSLKYHPDKNPADREHAEKIQKILGEIREQYVQ
jgi:hypothetical protein